MSGVGDETTHPWCPTAAGCALERPGWSGRGKVGASRWQEQDGRGSGLGLGPWDHCSMAMTKKRSRGGPSELLQWCGA